VRLWKRTTAKKKETRRERIERVRREAEDSPIVRELRELAAGRAEEDFRRRRAAAGS
jgi:hypothetical protein